MIILALITGIFLVWVAIHFAGEEEQFEEWERQARALEAHQLANELRDAATNCALITIVLLILGVNALVVTLYVALNGWS